MGTWAELLNSIQEEINRDDLGGVIPAFATERIHYAQRDFYYSSPVTRFMACVPGQNFYPIPTDMMSVAVMRLDNSGNWQLLHKTEYEHIFLADATIPPTRSVPSSWAPYDSGFRLYQTPDTAYALELTGTGRIPAPTADDDVNFWTDDAAEYIRCATIAQLYLRRIKDFEQFKAYSVAAEEFRIGLVRETIGKVCHSVLQSWW